MMISIDWTSNFAIRINNRAIFEYCNHYIMQFDRASCQSVPHTLLYSNRITLDNYLDCSGMGFSTTRMKEYLISQNDKMMGYLYYSVLDNRPVGCIWVAFKGANEFQYRVRKRDAFGFDFAVLPEYRGQGIIGFMICALMKVLGEQGIDTLFVSVRKNNTSAIRAYQKTGAKVVTSKRFFRVVGVRIPYPVI